MPSEHSPLPWHTDEDWPIMDCNNTRVADLYGKSITMATANAAYIVRACNNFENLMDIVRTLVQIRQKGGFWDEYGPDLTVLGNDAQRIMDSIKKETDNAK